MYCKNMRARILYSVAACMLLWLGGCEEPVIDEGIQPLTEPATVDATGGTWRTIVLQSAAEITVPEPAAITSDSYQKELSEIKNGLLGVNPEQNTAVNYWATGGVHRWNQLARLLISKYNVDPLYSNPASPVTTDGAFTSPPYAARLYALLSVAQYDALVVTWKAKYQYNRPSMSRQGINPRVPALDVPSYPSEDAAIAEASAQILTYFFPSEAEFIKTKATEHKQSRIWAGANVTSDVKAGEQLAAAVAAKVIARARADRFSLAADAGNTWQTAIAKAPYDVKWTSLEIPARSPMLPLGGKVKTWFDSTAVFRAASATPPATTSDAFKTALTEVRTIADSRTREQWRIADYWSDGVGTYTPAGHWNLIAEELIRQDRQNELRAARTYALMNRAMQDGITAAWYTKYTFFVPRPSQLDRAIKTASPIPNFPAYLSSHAAFASSAATVLGYIFPDNATSLSAQADEAAMSRLYGGVNYRFSNEEGARFGTAIGKMAVDWATADGSK